MSQQLPVRLRVMVPAVENAIDGGAFRPGDVLVARSGKTSEIGNTGEKKTPHAQTPNKNFPEAYDRVVIPPGRAGGRAGGRRVLDRPSCLRFGPAGW